VSTTSDRPSWLRARQRRTVLGVAGLVALSLVRAQPVARRPARVGYLWTATPEAPEGRPIAAAFRDGMREQGLVEGKDFVIEARYAAGKVERFASQAAELVALKVDLIVAQNSLSGRAAKQATSTIPIVVAVMADPVGDGLAASLARPGRNVTGLTFLGHELVPKRMALLKEALPKASRLGLLWHPKAYAQDTVDAMIHEADSAAKTLGLQVLRQVVQRPEDVDGAFAAMAAAAVDAVFVMPSPLLFNERRRIGGLAAQHRLPAAGNAREFAEFGCLMSYGASLVDLSRRAAGYVDRILKGAKPAELPIEQPTRFELVVNLKTAKALGITVPQSVLLRADEVIQ
jgi:putative ABC transport system substrate-binding protein